MEKLFIESNQLLKDSFKIALNVYESGFRPNYIVGVWRGGAPIGIAVQELLDIMGGMTQTIGEVTGAMREAWEKHFSMNNNNSKNKK